MMGDRTARCGKVYRKSGCHTGAMAVNKSTTDVLLFPLCDADSVLMDALLCKTDKPATRPDALVMAWRLTLPDSVSIKHAAQAILQVALSEPRESWTRSQLYIIRELMVLSGQQSRQAQPKVVRKPTATANRLSSTEKKLTEKTTEWRKLIGRHGKVLRGVTKPTPPKGPIRADSIPETPNPASLENSGQRKTRKGRVSREPLSD